MLLDNNYDPNVNLEQTEKLLNMLSEAEKESKLLLETFENEIRILLGEDLYQKYVDLSGSYQERQNQNRGVISSIKDQISNVVVRLGCSVKYAGCQAIYQKTSKSVKASDVEALANRWIRIYPRVAEDALSIIKDSGPKVIIRKGN